MNMIISTAYCFTDKVSPLRRRLLKGKLTAISKGKFEADYKTILPGQKIK